MSTSSGPSVNHRCWGRRSNGPPLRIVEWSAAGVAKDRCTQPLPIADCRTITGKGSGFRQGQGIPRRAQMRR
jgi:hypothetical protein